MSMNRGYNPSAVKTAIDEYFFSTFDYAEQPGFITAENPIAFKQRSTDKGAVITEQFGGPGEFIETVEEEANPEATIRSGNQVSRSISNFKKTIPIPKEYFDKNHCRRKIGLNGGTSKKDNPVPSMRLKSHKGLTTNG